MLLFSATLIEEQFFKVGIKYKLKGRISVGPIVLVSTIIEMNRFCFLWIFLLPENYMDLRSDFMVDRDFDRLIIFKLFFRGML
jgi:hypothetical protein